MISDNEGMDSRKFVKQEALSQRAFGSKGSECRGKKIQAGRADGHPGTAARPILWLCAMDTGHLVNWLQAMQARKEPNATVDHGFSHALVCIMAAQSYWSGRKLYFDLGKEELTDQPV